MVSAVNTKLSDLVSRTPINTASMTMGGHATAANALALSQLTPVSDIVRCNGTANYQVTAGLTAFTPNTEPVVFYTAAVNVSNREEGAERSKYNQVPTHHKIYTKIMPSSRSSGTQSHQMIPPNVIQYLFSYSRKLYSTNEAAQFIQIMVFGRNAKIF
jgi:hypothetical protein